MRTLALIASLIAGPAVAFEAGDFPGSYLLGEQIFIDAVVTRQVWLEVGPDTITATYIAPHSVWADHCEAIGLCSITATAVEMDYRLEGDLLHLTALRRMREQPISDEGLRQSSAYADDFLYVAPLTAALDGQRIAADADGVLHLSGRARAITLYPMTLEDALALRSLLRWSHVSIYNAHACAAEEFYARLHQPEAAGFLAATRLMAAIDEMEGMDDGPTPIERSPEEEELRMLSRLLNISAVIWDEDARPDSFDALVDGLGERAANATPPLPRTVIEEALRPHADAFPAFWQIQDAQRATAGGADFCADISYGLVPSAPKQ